VHDTYVTRALRIRIVHVTAAVRTLLTVAGHCHRPHDETNDVNKSYESDEPGTDRDQRRIPLRYVHSPAGLISSITAIVTDCGLVFS